MSDLKKYIRTIPNFPKDGIMFRDVTTLFANPEGMHSALDEMIALYENHQFDYVVGLEARGFVLGAALALHFKKGFIPIRKKGKLPSQTKSQRYALEYGEAVIEIHSDAFEAGAKILLHDDLIATGGTAEAGIKLVEELGGEVVSANFLIDLPDLGGRAKIDAMGIETTTLCAFDGH